MSEPELVVNEVTIDRLSQVLIPNQHVDLIAAGRKTDWGSHVVVVYAVWNDPDPLHKPAPSEAGLSLLGIAALLSDIADGIRNTAAGRAELQLALSQVAQRLRLSNDLPTEGDPNVPTNN